MGISKVIYDKKGKEKRIGNYAHVKANRAKKRKILVEAGGGKCKVCGYNRCIRNLHFHHLDPKEKEFGLSSVGNGLSLEKAMEEMKKCILVCSNCHGEIHSNLIDVNKYI